MTIPHYIKTEKTARYFVLGNPGAQTKVIWFVLHGYGQLAERFISKFQSLVDDYTVVVAPEALHRFYATGNSGRIGASWMTKEDRENDILDYVHYLNQVADVLVKNSSNAQIRVLGFSQGAATAARWIAEGTVKPEKLVLWGGLFPPDMDWDATLTTWKTQRVTVLIGDEDEFYKADEFKKYYEPVFPRFAHAHFIHYKGKHDIYEEELKKLK